jgi:alkylation response protein AidB-like acyl-CoA dehydrogenase
MEYFWWTDEQKSSRMRYRRSPRNCAQRRRDAGHGNLRRLQMAEKGYPGAGVPKEYGGLGLGATGCIASEAFNRMPGPGRTL